MLKDSLRLLHLEGEGTLHSSNTFKQRITPTYALTQKYLALVKHLSNSFLFHVEIAYMIILDPRQHTCFNRAVSHLHVVWRGRLIAWAPAEGSLQDGPTWVSSSMFPTSSSSLPFILLLVMTVSLL